MNVCRIVELVCHLSLVECFVRGWRGNIGPRPNMRPSPHAFEISKLQPMGPAKREPLQDDLLQLFLHALCHR